MVKTWTLALAAALLPGAASAQSTGYGQVTFDNQTSVTGDMYVDDTYQCRALAHLFCTAQVEAGVHVAEFRFADGDAVTTPSFELEAGAAITIPIGERVARKEPVKVLADKRRVAGR